MGKGGSSSSRSSTQNTNVNGTSAISGDNLGVVLSGINGSSINVTATDHGAMKTAENMAKAAMASNTEAMKQASNLSSEAIKSNERVIDKSFDFGEKSLNAVSKTNSEAIDAMKVLAAQSSENTRTALKVAEKAKTHEQTGTAPQMTKIALGVSGALAVGMVALAWSKK
ncbi:hypothetical protein [Vibrio aquimaris]|uniref:Uncharacterized protein n=1 Tax=Vibrio aquimaris TaxID=2587862 RepID=A0A5P9CPU8_9VIBR|nr:hypothetical protein [Vibrio aquimaris]QFT27817.1 hypothetical protein FIV01_15620 [Vibrio aquimaris]